MKIFKTEKIIMILSTILAYNQEVMGNEIPQPFLNDEQDTYHSSNLIPSCELCSPKYENTTTFQWGLDGQEALEFAFYPDTQPWMDTDAHHHSHSTENNSLQGYIDPYSAQATSSMANLLPQMQSLNNYVLNDHSSNDAFPPSQVYEITNPEITTYENYLHNESAEKEERLSSLYHANSALWDAVESIRKDKIKFTQDLRKLKSAKKELQKKELHYIKGMNKTQPKEYIVITNKIVGVKHKLKYADVRIAKLEKEAKWTMEEIGKLQTD
ncbi:hypothetical protein ENBRE01_2850 [Enteropsectra breve]|nr:hypothetical protein ENBRE01_2850 [Enteropsectra breve]